MPAGARFEALRSTVREHRLAHGLRGGAVPEHRRVLERRHRDAHADGRGLHARLPLLRGGYRQPARLARRRRAGERRAHGRADEPRLRRADLGRIATTCPTAAPRTSPPACARSSAASPHTAVEALTPDFQGVLADVETVVDSGLDVFAQNVETVRAADAPGARSARRLRPDARRARACQAHTGRRC